jgi:hypothetical protein
MRRKSGNLAVEATRFGFVFVGLALTVSAAGAPALDATAAEGGH